jgi:hypothetical protein
LASLCYRHWRAADVTVPTETRRLVQGLYLRHRRANDIRLKSLGQLLGVLRAAAIPVLVLKGAALASLVYPEPGLRPMRDLDLLVKPADAHRVQQMLFELGFTGPRPVGSTLPAKHLPAVTLETEGLAISVETHHNLFADTDSVSMTLDDLTGPPLQFRLADGTEALTLGHEDMLWHLCQHLLLPAAFNPMRLIWVADIVSFAECFAEAIDWNHLKSQYPVVLSTLGLLHYLTPLSDSLCRQAGLVIGPEPAGVGLDFRGWPRASLADQRRKGYRQIIIDTLYPPEWWLRLYYGLGSTGSIAWYRWGHHPRQVLRWMVQWLRQRRHWPGRG